MISFLKYFKDIAYFLAILILFQSCIAYNKNSSTIEEAMTDEEMPIKIITKDGKEYKLSWIEEKDGNLVSIKDVKKEYFEKEEIAQFAILNPEPHAISLDEAVMHQGTVRLLIRDHKDKYISHQFIRISEDNDRIIGYKITGKDTMTVIIPIDQIEKIQLKNKGKSTGRTVGLIVGIGLGVILFASFISLIISFVSGDW